MVANLSMLHGVTICTHLQTKAVTEAIYAHWKKSARNGHCVERERGARLQCFSKSDHILKKTNVKSGRARSLILHSLAWKKRKASYIAFVSNILIRFVLSAIRSSSATARAAVLGAQLRISLYRADLEDPYNSRLIRERQVSHGRDPPSIVNCMPGNSTVCPECIQGVNNKPTHFGLFHKRALHLSGKGAELDDRVQTRSAD